MGPDNVHPKLLRYLSEDSSFVDAVVLLLSAWSSETGVCAWFLKGVGEELARSAGSEVAASEAICGNGPGRSPRKYFQLNFMLNK